MVLYSAIFSKFIPIKKALRLDAQSLHYTSNRTMFLKSADMS